MLTSSSSSQSLFDQIISNSCETISPLAGVCISTSHSCVCTITGVIQLTVAVADPVAPSVFPNANVCDPLPVNVCVAHPVLVTVTPALENHVIVATTVPVVLVEGL